MSPLGRILSKDEQDLNFRAQMTQHQFEAIAYKLKVSAILNELSSISYFHKFKKSKKCDIKEVEKWIKNGWNTEFLIRSNASELKGDILRSSLPWAFPQSYYSSYTICLAFFNVAGFTESSHNSVISKIGKLMHEGKYPNTISFLANGGPKNISFDNINNHRLPNSLYFNLQPEVVDAQICQFLKSTRKNDLDEKKNTIDCRTTTGKRKKNFSPRDWEKVSDKLGFTSIFSLLYRKRIKSNYREIDTFLCSKLNPDVIYADIIKIISSLNIIHEAYILKGIGIDKYNLLQNNLLPEVKEMVSNRMLRICKTIA